MLLSNPPNFDNLVLLQHKDLQDLKALAKASNTSEWTPPLTELVDRVITHYENHYRVESKLFMDEVRFLLLLFPDWHSHQLHDSFLWVGGWRPSITLHLLAPHPTAPPSQLGELLEQVTLKQQADLSPSQLVRFGDLMRQTVQEETELSRFLSESTELTQPDSALPLLLSLGGVFSKADDLRVRTLKSLVTILSPIQAVQFFTPAAELHLIARQRAVQDRGPPEAAYSVFFERWQLEQARDLEELWKYTTESTELTRSTESTWRLLTRILCHYESYYRVKSELIHQNVLQMLNPTWVAPLEHAFFWIGGWRPTISIHLLYSVMGLQLDDSRLTESLLPATTGGNVGDMTGSQLGRVDELHMITVKQERELTETLATLQESVADSCMVELSHIATELKRTQGTESVSERVELKLCVKEEKLKEVFCKADDLRLKTLKGVVEILSPIQGLHFLIAAAELHLRFHDWGKHKHDDAGELQLPFHG